MTHKSPRNYLARSEKRRVFWLFMPPAIVAVLALGWIERTWFPRKVSSAAKQIDTSLAAVRGARPAGDAVLIEAEPEPFVPTAEELSASVDALARIRDDAFFRKEEEEAWVQTWLTLRSGNQAAILEAAPNVSFTELFGQPMSFRGRLVRFKGTLKRLERLKAPANDYDIQEYWQGWLEPAGGPASPIVVHFRSLPEGMPTGMKIDEPVQVAGYSFKRYAYKASDTIRRAPLVLASEPVWMPRPPLTPGGTSLGTVALVTMAGLVLATVLGMHFAGRGSPRSPDQTPTDLNAALSDVELFSTEESLRRLAESKCSTTTNPSQELPR
jgi:hypothetical protein